MEKNHQTELVKTGERVDDLQNGFYVIQNQNKFCFGMDAVLLSGFARIRKGDYCTGYGYRYRNYSNSSEIQRQKENTLLVWRYRKNVQIWLRGVFSIMDWNPHVDIVCGDIKEAAGIFGAASFDVVTSNPPYMIGAPWIAESLHGKSNRTDMKSCVHWKM